MNVIVTTIKESSNAVEQLGEQMAISLEVPFIVRGNRSIQSIKDEYGVQNVLVATQQGPVVHTAGGEFFFHLNMAELRIQNILKGKQDHMISAMGLEQGMTVLDCTLGLATDAIVASFIIGSEGRVVGLEASSIIALLTCYGLQNFSCESNDLLVALRSIQVENSNHDQYLARLPENSFDVVYFDPMFRRPIHTSSNLKSLRYLADSRSLTQDAIREACRVAKQRVVIKEAYYSNEFSRLGMKKIVGGKYSRIHYGVIDIASEWGARC